MTLPTPPESPFAVCAGIAALDVIMESDGLPGRDQRVTATSSVLAGGGPAATAAVAIARLGGRATLAAVTGDDDAGALIRLGLAREGVSMELVSIVPDRGSAVSIGLVPSDAPTTRALVAFQDSAAPVLSEELAAQSAAAAWVHVDHAGWSIVPWLRGRGIATPISVDGGNPITGLDLTGIELYVPSATELLRWTGATAIDAALDRALDLGATICVATLGGAGAVARTSLDPREIDVTSAIRRRALHASNTGASTWTVRTGPVPLTVRSTLGAGDVYHGALLAALMRGDSLVAAMAFAAVAAARSCTAIDGRSGIPGLSEVDAAVGQVLVEVAADSSEQSSLNAIAGNQTASLAPAGR